MVRDPTTGKYRRARLFVLTLGYSRKCVRLLTWRSSAQIWAELHERAFRRLGGTRQGHRARQLGRRRAHAGHLRSDAESALSRRPRALRRRRAAVSRAAIPIAKGKSRPGVGHAQKTPLKGLRFETIEAAQAYLDRWETHWADTRIHGTTKRQVAVMFAEERPALGPLPLEPFRYYRFGDAHGASRRLRRSRGRLLRRAARLDRAARAGAVERPPRPADRAADGPAPARASARAARLASHRGRRPADAHAGLDRWRLLGRAATAGAHIGTVCQHIHAQGSAHGVRQILGVLALARKHGTAVVDDAAKAAIDIGVPHLSLHAEVRRTSSAGAAHLAPSRSAHPATHALPRSD